jgi:predicted class III extradiol MEMO1 family dioxygenase
MASLVSACAVSHTALMLRAKADASPGQAERVYGAFAEMRRRISAARVEVLVILSPEHLKTFFLDNMPALCVGLGERSEGWGEAGVPRLTVPVAGDLAAHLVQYALDRGVDVAFAYEMRLDHGFMVPIQLLTEGGNPLPVVPVFVNCATPPLAPPWRVAQWGKIMAEALADYDQSLRVGVVATGGLSHWVGVPQMGTISEAFDRRFLARLQDHGEEEYYRWSNHRIETEAGNGGLEIRTWLALAAMVPEGERQLLCYEPVSAWATGMAVMDFMAGQPL